MLKESVLAEKRTTKIMRRRALRLAKARADQTWIAHGRAPRKPAEHPKMSAAHQAVLAAYSGEPSAQKGWGGRIAEKISGFFRRRAE